MTVAAQVTNYSMLCEYLGLAPQRVYFFSKNSDTLYKAFTIPKRNGSPRILHVPALELKGIQRIILKKILNFIPVSDCAFGFVPRRSTKDAATQHSGNRHLLKFDIVDFFPSIGSGRVYGLFKKLGFTGEVSFTLTKLTTYDGKLPQGAPTSPYIANLIAGPFDAYMDTKTKAANCTYTRYADDIAISAKSDSPNIRAFLTKVPFHLKKHGFSVNLKKTLYCSPVAPRRYLGINLESEKLRPSRVVKREIRQLCHYANRHQAMSSGSFERLIGLSEYYAQIAGKDDIYRNARSAIRSYRATLSLKEHIEYQLPGI